MGGCKSQLAPACSVRSLNLCLVRISDTDQRATLHSVARPPCRPRRCGHFPVKWRAYTESLLNTSATKRAQTDTEVWRRQCEQPQACARTHLFRWLSRATLRTSRVSSIFSSKSSTSRTTSHTSRLKNSRSLSVCCTCIEAVKAEVRLTQRTHCFSARCQPCEEACLRVCLWQCTLLLAPKASAFHQQEDRPRDSFLRPRSALRY